MCGSCKITQPHNTPHYHHHKKHFHPADALVQKNDLGKFDEDKCAGRPNGISDCSGHLFYGKRKEINITDAKYNIAY